MAHMRCPALQAPVEGSRLCSAPLEKGKVPIHDPRAVACLAGLCRL
jgi:hypothetical protein